MKSVKTEIIYHCIIAMHPLHRKKSVCWKFDMQQSLEFTPFIKNLKIKSLIRSTRQLICKRLHCRNKIICAAISQFTNYVETTFTNLYTRPLNRKINHIWMHVISCISVFRMLKIRYHCNVSQSIPPSATVT